MTDRGGLNYRIAVEDSFSSNLRAFRGEVDKSKAAWRSFRKEFTGTANQTGRIRKDIEAVNRALRERNKQTAVAQRTSRARAKALGIEVAARRADTKATNEQNVAGLQRTKSLNTETRSVQRLTRAYNQLRTARGRDTTAALRRDGRASVGTSGVAVESASRTRSRAKAVGSLADNTDRSGRAANRASFTFRRLFGILAAFTIARQGISGFGRLTSDAIRLNAELEQSTLGVASLFTALGDVVTPSGLVADNAERLALAQGEARQQLELLRVDALKTAATYKELADTFQVALAPGFQAGLDLDEIRRLTIRISQAAGAIGLPQNQLPEEIRSLLTGTITPRTTRIATALGITNEDIRNAKEAGNLVDFLEVRFAAFAQAGEEALGTFSAISTNLRDGFQQILRIGGLDFFNELKGQLKGILDDLAVIDDSGQLVFNEGAIETVKLITEGLKVAVQEAGLLRESLSIDDAQNIGKLLGQGLATAAKTARPLVQAVTKVLSILGGVVDFLSQFGLASDAAADFLVSFVSLVALSKTVLLTLGAIQKVSALVTGQTIATAAATAAAAKGATAFSINMARARAAAVPAALLVSGLVLAFSALTSEAKTVSQQADNLSSALGRMPQSVRDTNAELEGQKELFEDIRKQVESTANAFELTVGTAGLEGVVKQQAEATIRLRQQTRDLTEKQIQEEQRLEEAIKASAQQRLDSQRGIREFIRNEEAVNRRTFGLVEEADKKLTAINKKRVDNEREILGLQNDQSDAAQIRLKSLEFANKNLETSSRLLRQSLISDVSEQVKDEFLDVDTLNEFAGRVGSIFSGIFSGQNFDDVSREAAAQLIDKITEKLKESQQVEADIAAIQATQNNLQRARNNLISQESTLRAAQIRQIAEQALGPVTRDRDRLLPGGGFIPGDITGVLDEENTLLAQQDANRQRLRETINSLGNVQRTVALNNLELAERELFFLKERNRLQAEATQRAINDNRSRQSTVSGRLDEIVNLRTGGDVSPEQDQNLLEERNQLSKEAIFLRAAEQALLLQQGQQITKNNLLEAEHLETVSDLKEEYDRTENSVRNIGEGIREGLREANEQVKTTAEIAADVVVGAVQSASKLIADTIVDAFDPTKDATLEQRIGSFLQGIARQLLQLTTQALIFRALVGAGFGGASGGGLVGGAASGGPVPAQGFNTGGRVGMSPARPAGLAASDTVPAWLTPGEHVIKKPSVRMYGADLVEKINQGLIDPGSLRSLAGLTGRRRASSRPKGGMGFATGGPVPSASPAPAAAPQEGPNMPVVALPADNATLEALLTGGAGAYMTFVQSNKRQIRAALGV